MTHSPRSLVTVLTPISDIMTPTPSISVPSSASYTEQTRDAFPPEVLDVALTLSSSVFPCESSNALESFSASLLDKKESS